MPKTTVPSADSCANRSPLKDGNGWNDPGRSEWACCGIPTGTGAEFDWRARAAASCPQCGWYTGDPADLSDHCPVCGSCFD